MKTIATKSGSLIKRKSRLWYRYKKKSTEGPHITSIDAIPVKNMLQKSPFLRETLNRRNYQLCQRFASKECVKYLGMQLWRGPRPPPKFPFLDRTTTIGVSDELFFSQPGIIIMRVSYLGKNHYLALQNSTIT